MAEAMTDKKPAKIAKYLLKGWCLLNEYCPNGSNIPLLRSREGQLLCVCGNPACPYHSGPDAPTPAVSSATPAPVDKALSTSPTTQAEVEATQPISHRSSGGSGGYCSLRAAHAGKGDARPMVDEAALVTLQSPAYGWSCTRLESGRGQRSRLVGDCLQVKVRLGLPSAEAQPLPSTELQEAVRIQRDKLDEKVLISRSCSVSSDGGMNMSVHCMDGTTYSLPERDCVMVPGASLSTKTIASHFLEEMFRSPAAETLLSGGAAWAEATLCEGSGAEVTFRTAIPGRPGAAPRASPLGW